MNLEVITARPWHCGQISRILRVEHDAGLRRCGAPPHAAFRERLSESYLTRAWAIDGKFVGLAGVIGTPLSVFGGLWCGLSVEATKHPLAVVREARRLLSDAMVTKREILTSIIGGDEAALRLAVFLGFHVKHDLLGEPQRSRSGRRSLREFLKSNEELRVPIGEGYAFAMNYHEDEAA